MLPTQFIKPITALLLVSWAFALCLTLAATAIINRQALTAELTSKSSILHRLASQRADQHDAHLTALSSVFVAGGAESQDLVLDVAATITRFYPRITSVHVVPLDPSKASIETRPTLSSADASLVRQMAERSTGDLQIGQSTEVSQYYLIVKRSPNTAAAKHATALVIDAPSMVAAFDARCF